MVYGQVFLPKMRIFSAMKGSSLKAGVGLAAGGKCRRIFIDNTSQESCCQRLAIDKPGSGCY
jgi:hypothetical protein